MQPSPFSSDVVEAVATHLNVDHRQDCLLIARALGPDADIAEARVVDLDADGVDFLVSDGADRRIFRIPVSEHLTERSQLRAEFVRLHEAAVAVLDARAE